jgi:hypothetical protein
MLTLDKGRHTGLYDSWLRGRSHIRVPRFKSAFAAQPRMFNSPLLSYTMTPADGSVALLCRTQIDHSSYSFISTFLKIT